MATARDAKRVSEATADAEAAARAQHWASVLEERGETLGYTFDDVGDADADAGAAAAVGGEAVSGIGASVGNSAAGRLSLAEVRFSVGGGAARASSAKRRMCLAMEIWRAREMSWKARAAWLGADQCRSSFARASG